MHRPSAKQAAKTLHPAWNKFWTARRAWSAARDETARLYTELLEAKNELVRAGEMKEDML
jgi:hypothetical protein